MVPFRKHGHTVTSTIYFSGQMNIPSEKVWVISYFFVFQLGLQREPPLTRCLLNGWNNGWNKVFFQVLGRGSALVPGDPLRGVRRGAARGAAVPDQLEGGQGGDESLRLG